MMMSRLFQPSLRGAPRSRLAAGALLVTAVAVGACGRAGEPERATRPPIDVRVAQATTETLADRHEAGGIVQAREAATLTSRIMAPVREVRVRPGDRVRTGQVLVVLDDRDLAAEARRARAAGTAAEESARAAASNREAAAAALTLAEATHRRISQLSERKSATPRNSTRRRPR